MQNPLLSPVAYCVSPSCGPALLTLRAGAAIFLRYEPPDARCLRKASRIEWTSCAVTGGAALPQALRT
jgi:hypothetical protein